MIVKLRRRLTLLVVGILILVSAGIVLSIHLVNLRNIKSAAETALKTIADNGGQRPYIDRFSAQPPQWENPEDAPAPPEWGEGLPQGPETPADGEKTAAVGASSAEGENAADAEIAAEPAAEGEKVSDAENATEGEPSNPDAAARDEGLQPGMNRGRGWRGELSSGTDTLATLSNFYTIHLDPDGGVTDWFSDRSDLYSDDQIEAIAGRILSDGKDQGKVDTQFYRCLAGDDGSRRLIVLDARLEYLSAGRVLRATALVAALACLLLSAGACLLIRRMLRPVQESFERQKQFAWDASHELKTPLAVISANADVLAEEVGDNEYLGYIRSEVGRADRLVQNLLTLARMDKGTVSAQMKRFDLSKALLSVALPFESTVFEAGKTLETDVPEGILCRGDEAMLQQLAVILLSNALKYSNEGGTIRLSLAAKGKGSVITVSNTGPGIAPEHLEKIFDRFYREDASHNSEISGSGLGLAIARTIVEAHRGRIHAESEPGKSATFIVSLPA